MARTLKSLAEEKHADDRPLAVLIQGDPQQDPPQGRAASVRVASLLADDDDEVSEITPPDWPVERGGTLLCTIVADDGYDEWNELRKVLARRRVRDMTIIAHTDSAPKHILHHTDVRISVGEDGIDEIERVRYDPYDDGFVMQPLAGLVSER